MDGRSKAAAKLGEINEKMQGSQAWNSIFRPGSVFRKGYTDSPRNRSYVIMNSVLYHLHPVKVSATRSRSPTRSASAGSASSCSSCSPSRASS